MILKVFRENQTFTIILSFLLSIGLWILAAYHTNLEPDYQTLFNTSLYFLFPGLKAFNSFRIICSAINILFVGINGFYLSRIAYKYQLFPKRTIIPLFIFLVITIPYFVAYSGLSYPLITLTILLRVIQILFASLEKQKIGFGYFDSALLISVASIFNFYSLFFILFLIYVLFQFKGAGIREFLFIIIGLIVPYIILIAILYLTNQDINAFIDSYSEMFSMRTTLPVSLFLIVLLSFAGFMVFVSSLNIMNSFVKMKIVTRKYAVLFLVLFITSLLIAVFYPIADKDIIFYLGLPLSYLFGHYFSTCKYSLINQLLFIALIGGNIAVLFLR